MGLYEYATRASSHLPCTRTTLSSLPHSQSPYLRQVCEKPDTLRSSSGHSNQDRDEHLPQARPMASVLRLSCRKGKLLLADARKRADDLLTGICPYTLASWCLILQASVKSRTANPMCLSHGIYTDSLCLPDKRVLCGLSRASL